MISYTIQHVLIMRLLMQYPLKMAPAIHNLLFLVSALYKERFDLAFYDFVRLDFGPYSPILQTILDELMVNQLLGMKDLELTPKGREIYYNLATTLRSFEDFINKCTDVMTRSNNDVKQLQKTVKRNFVLRKTPVGTKVFV